jgi:hypothetical protein
MEPDRERRRRNGKAAAPTGAAAFCQLVFSQRHRTAGAADRIYFTFTFTEA